MSAIPTIAEVLSEQLGRSPVEIETLIREALAEVNRRRWRKLSPEERAELQEELERARSVNEQPFPSEDIARIPLSLLPLFIRRVREDLATAREVWREAFDRYQELARSRTLWYHEKEHLQITAAEKKATLDPRVQEAAKGSLDLKQRVDALERAEANLLQELEVRLVLVRSGVLPDAEAIRPL
jgi:hypothetical protein